MAVHVRWFFLVLSASLLFAPPGWGGETEEESDPWTAARQRAEIYADCGRNVSRLLQGWLDQKQDPDTGLFPRGGTWDYHNEAADHYSSLVLMAFYVDPAAIQPGGPLHRTLTGSRQLCTSPGGLPALFDLRTRTTIRPASLGELSEWLRDGLIRIVEVLGMDNDWGEELRRLTDTILQEAADRGGMATAFRGPEARGNMLQTLARLAAASGKESYLRSAEELADAALLDPAGALGDVRFQDHGCELVPGLGELLAVECRLGRAKSVEYRGTMRDLLDGMLERYSHPETGMLCRRASLADGRSTWDQPPDTWGYVLFALENYDRATGENRYSGANEKPMRWLVTNRHRYEDLRDTLWPRGRSSDDWSDSYESMILLWHRYRDVPGVFEWLDWATLQHVHRRFPERKYGPFTGGHFDGSTGRTLCLHMMLCSQGVRADPCSEAIGVGALKRGGDLLVVVRADGPWQGRLCFDRPRNEYAAATMDWARLNEMPQWFVVRPEREYRVTIDGEPRVVEGGQLIQGLPFALPSGRERRIRVAPSRAP